MGKVIGMLFGVCFMIITVVAAIASMVAGIELIINDQLIGLLFILMGSQVILLIFKR